jgi:hypothetical protein
MNIYVKEIPANNFRFIQPDNQYSLYMIVDCFNNYFIPGTWGFSIDTTYTHVLTGVDKDVSLYSNEPRFYNTACTTPSTSVDDVNDLITIIDNPLKHTDIITMSSTITTPDPFIAFDEYSVYIPIGNDIQLTTNPADTNPIDITSQGAGIITFRKKWKLDYFDLAEKYTNIYGDGSPRAVSVYGFRCDSKANYLADMKTYILNVAAQSLSWWKSATILFGHVNYVAGDTTIDAYISFVYHGNDGVLI